MSMAANVASSCYPQVMSLMSASVGAEDYKFEKKFGGVDVINRPLQLILHLSVRLELWYNTNYTNTNTITNIYTCIWKDYLLVDPGQKLHHEEKRTFQVQKSTKSLLKSIIQEMG